MLESHQEDIQTICKEAIDFCKDTKNVCEASSTICGYIIFFDVFLYILYSFQVMKAYGFFQNYEFDVSEKLYDLIWKLLRVYSLVNSKFKKHIGGPLNSAKKRIHKHVKYYIGSHPNRYILVRDGEEIMRFTKLDGLIAYYLFRKDGKDDELICNRDDDMIYYIKFEKFFYGNHEIINDNFDDNNLDKIKKSSIKFMTCHIELNIKNKETNKIISTQKEMNLEKFMLVSNMILSYSFVMWYCNKYFGIDIDSIQSYKINIIDQDVDQIEIDMNDYIEIYKDEYLIHKKKHSMESIDEDAEDDNDTPLLNDLDKIITNDVDDDNESYSVNNNKYENTSNNSESDSESEYENQHVSSTESSSETDTISENNNENDRLNENNQQIRGQLISNVEEHIGLQKYDENSSECEYHKYLKDDTERFTESTNKNLSSSWMPSFMLF